MATAEIEATRARTAVITLKEGAHEVEIFIDGKSVRFIAENAVVIGNVIANTECRPEEDKTKPC